MAKTNYNKMSNRHETVVEAKVEKVAVSPGETVIVEPVEVDKPEPKTKHGTVTGCILLNIRKKPNTSADIMGTLSVGDEVVILDEVGEFYKIEKSAGNAFCMKKYITIKQ